MAKKKGRKEARVVLDEGDRIAIPAGALEAADRVEISAKPVPSRFYFERRPQCPKCKRQNSTAKDGTQGGVQYRRCRMPSCRHRWKAQGKAVL